MTIKYRNSKIVVELAILHMIGQMEDLQQTVKISDIAIYLRVTKQTASRYLKSLVEDNLLKCWTLPYRGNISINTYYLTTKARYDYRMGKYKQMYFTFLASLGIELYK